MKIATLILLIGFGLGSACDVVTTILGIGIELGGNLIQWFWAFGGTVVVIVLNIKARDAWINKQWLVLLSVCVPALFFDFYTSFTGVKYIPSDIQEAVMIEGGIMTYIILAFIAFVFVVSPIFFWETLTKKGKISD